MNKVPTAEREATWVDASEVGVLSLGGLCDFGGTLMAQDQSSTALTPEPVAHPDDRASLPRPKWLFEYVYHFSEAAGPPHPAVLLLRAWLRDESGYDEAVWPELREALHEDRLSRRKLFR